MSRWTIVFPVLVLALGCFGSQQPSNQNLIVKTKSGRVAGAVHASDGAEFLGIPFAQPPVGNLRWHEPVPIKPWSDVRDARKFGAPCAQSILGDWNKHDAETSSEDCLYLNVITPFWPVRERLPVMFWIHGGANAGGTASSALYKDGTLANHGVILVTVNYRLGIFGFFSHPDLSRESPHHASGNYGLMDQISALQWVHDNIAAFGGDPNNVTVFGQSAGGQDTSLLMTSPLAKLLFHKAIAQSGAAINPNVTPLVDSEKAGVQLATTLGAPVDAQLKFLRNLPTDQLLKAAVQDPTRPPVIGPNIDGWVIPRSPSKVFSEKQQLPIPLLIGTTAREFAFNGTTAQARQFIKNFSGRVADRALAVYGISDNSEGTTDPLYGSVADQAFADLLFRCPATTQAMSQSELNPSTYEYELQHAIPGQETQGAVHSADLPYVFGYFPKSGNISGNFGAVDSTLADLIETYWTNFARTGNPNGAHIPNWPQFGGAQQYVRFNQDGTVSVNAELRKAQCDVYREAMKRRAN